MADRLTDAMRTGFDEAAVRESGKRKDLYHDDQTLTRVRDILLHQGWGLEETENIIGVLLNNNILFRQFKPDDEKLPQDSDHPLTLEELIFVNLGTAAMCWIPGPGDAEYDSAMASRIGHRLIRSLRARGAR